MSTSTLVTPAIVQRREQVAALYPTLTLRAIAKQLGATHNTIASDCRALGIHKRWTQRAAGSLPVAAAWDAAHLEILSLMYHVMQAAALGELLGRTEKAIKNKAYEMRLSKRRALIVKAKPASTVKAKPMTTTPPRSPARMTPAELAAHEKRRVTYTADNAPWKLRIMNSPPWTPPPLTYRGQVAAR